MKAFQRAVLVGFLAALTVLNSAFAVSGSLPSMNLVYGSALAFGLGFVGAYGITEAVQVGKTSVLASKGVK